MSPAPVRFFRAIGLGALVAFVYGLLRSARHRPAPTPSGAATWPPLVHEPVPQPRSGPVQFAATHSVESPTEPAAPAGQTWIEPVAGECPASHPIKGNADSMIFHVPGGMSYERTAAERCYCTADDAEADGFRQAKR